MICPDCQRAEREFWPVFMHLPCCEARHLMTTVLEKDRRKAALKLKAGVSVEFWAEMRERLDELMDREGQSDAREGGRRATAQRGRVSGHPGQNEAAKIGDR